jgi:hypothetical protein
MARDCRDWQHAGWRQCSHLPVSAQGRCSVFQSFPTNRTSRANNGHGTAWEAFSQSFRLRTL